MNRLFFLAALAFASGYVLGSADGFAEGVNWAPFDSVLARY